MEKLEELSHKTYYQMEKYSQLTIDMVEDVQTLLSDAEDGMSAQMFNEYNGAKQYEINNILEIINPELKDDIEALKKLIDILENCKLV
jgi:hypothetical protein